MPREETLRPQNRCFACGRTWFPRGQDLSAQCPTCGSPEVGFVPPPPGIRLSTSAAVLAGVLVAPIIVGGLFLLGVLGPRADKDVRRADVPPPKAKPVPGKTVKKQADRDRRKPLPEPDPADEARMEEERRKEEARAKADAEERERREFPQRVRRWLDALNAPRPDERAAALRSLAAAGPKAQELEPTAFDDVTALLMDPAEAVREAAFAAAAGIGGSRRDTVPALIAALKGGTAPVRLHACRLLGSLGPDAQDAAGALAAGLAEARLRDAASAALVGMGKAAARPLADLLAGPDADAAACAARALGKLGADASVAAPSLAAALARKEARADAAEALALIGGPSVAPLIEALSSKDDEVRNAAAMTLGHIGGAARKALPTLEKMITFDDARKVRFTAGTAVERIKRAK